MSKFFFCLVFIGISAFAKGQQNSYMKITLQDTAQLRVVRTYIVQHVVNSGFSRDNMILWVDYLNDPIQPGMPQQWISATSRKDVVRNRPPAFYSEVDGYRIAVSFGHLEARFIKYSTAHFDEIAAILLPGLSEKPPFIEETFDINRPDGTVNRRTIAKDPRPSEGFPTWQVTYPEGRPASWRVVERGAVIEKVQVIKSVFIKPSKK